jgi:hypothetical protein
MQLKDSKLRWAIDRSAPVNESYYDQTVFGILGAFLKGTGYPMHHDYEFNRFSGPAKEEALKDKMKFLMITLHNMIGHEPKLVEEDGQSWIYYS